MRTTILVLLSTCLVLLADESPFQNLKFENLGFQTSDGFILVRVKDGHPSWPKGVPKDVKTREFWDQVKLMKSEDIDISSYTVAQAIEDWNSFVQTCKANAVPDGNPEANAKRLWKCLKKLFPHITK